MRTKNKYTSRCILGMKFGNLSPLYRTDRITIGGGRGSARLHYLCRCDCGNYHEVMKHALTSGGTKSCGCIGRYLQTENWDKLRDGRGGGGRKSTSIPEYRTWIGMKHRCSPKNPQREDYFDRGIRVCDEWSKNKTGFVAFFEHMGPRPGPDYSLDRIDNSLGYQPGNCRWATAQVQTDNRRENKSIGKFSKEEFETEMSRRGYAWQQVQIA